MTIETKYNIGDKVWFTTMGGHPTVAYIVGIKIICIKNSLIEYLFLDYAPRLESAISLTKEELLNSL